MMHKGARLGLLAIAVMAAGTTLVLSGCNSKGASGDVTTQKPLPPEAREQMQKYNSGAAANAGRTGRPAYGR